MNLLVIRHGIAEDRDVWAQSGESDNRRPLTEEGRSKMKRAARGLARVVSSIDVLASSPLVRALQTAETVAKQYDGLEPVVVAELDPETPFPGLLAWLQRLDDADTVAIVGHEPHLSGFVSWLLTGQSQSVLELKKGAACLVAFPQERQSGKATLLWALTPGQLRKLAQ
ncbi:MAG TPA: phosphohistidine phosphatase SixA [Longimicrobiales bacterium]|nr:phosphohistidine phosphatase SixA [Longimicrobiales bacterium]